MIIDICIIIFVVTQTSYLFFAIWRDLKLSAQNTLAYELQVEAYKLQTDYHKKGLKEVLELYSATVTKLIKLENKINDHSST